jgi:hypothetical protein
MFMPKQPISVTLEEENVLWLRGRTVAGRRRSLSDALDRIVTEARTQGRTADAKSVVGTLDIAAADPALRQADAAIRALFDAAISSPGGSQAAPRRKPARKAAARG